MARRWSRRATRSLTIAVLAGAVAMTAVDSLQRDLRRARAAEGPTAPVIVAARDLDRGSRPVTSDLAVVEMPIPYVPPGSFRAIDEVVGHALSSDLAAGEAVTATRVGTRGGAVGAIVPPGLRGIVVRVDLPVEALEAGDRADVLATLGGQTAYTQTVARDVEVLAVLGADDAGDGIAVVLLVGADTAERIAHVMAVGSVTLTIAGSAP